MWHKAVVCFVVLATFVSVGKAQCGKWIGSVIVPITECACACPMPTVPASHPTCTYVFQSCRRETANDVLFPGVPSGKLGPLVYCDAVKPCCQGCACDGTPPTVCGNSTVCHTENVTTWAPASCILSNITAEYNSILAVLGVTFITQCEGCFATAQHCSDTYTNAFMTLQVGVGVNRCYRWIWVMEVYCQGVFTGTQTYACPITQTSSMTATKIIGKGCTTWCDTCPENCP